MKIKYFKSEYFATRKYTPRCSTFFNYGDILHPFSKYKSIVTEVHAINEHSDYLVELVHELGLELKASAVSKLVRRIRYGHFTLTHALLRKHWTLQAILENIDFCRPLVTPDKLLRQRQLVEQQFPAGLTASTNYLLSDVMTSHS